MIERRGDFRTLTPDDTLARAVEHILAGFQQDFPVVERDGRLVGVLTRADLIRALSEAGRTGVVGEVMQREFHTATPFDMAEGILARLQECDCHSLPVVQNGRFVGLLMAESLGEFPMIQGALKGGETSVGGKRSRWLWMPEPEELSWHGGWHGHAIDWTSKFCIMPSSSCSRLWQCWRKTP